MSELEPDIPSEQQTLDNAIQTESTKESASQEQLETENVENVPAEPEIDYSKVISHFKSLISLVNYSHKLWNDHVYFNLKHY